MTARMRIREGDNTRVQEAGFRVQVLQEAGGRGQGTAGIWLGRDRKMTLRC
jgi:hypothetical protein